MKLKDIIKAPKTITAPGKWMAGKMPRAAFPLSKSGNKAYRLGNRRWRVTEFQIGSAEFRLLINFNRSLQQYQAMLGLTHGTDTKVLATLEYHGTHGSWHAHVCCESLDTVPSGIKRGPWVKRLPDARRYNRAEKFDIDDDTAFACAVDFFGLDKAEASTDEGTTGKLL